MQRQSVSSSNLRSVGYDQWSGTLEIEFRGGRVYAYYSVPHERYVALMNAGSKGSHFYYNIKGRYNYRRL
jgi:hypothetical protein